MSGDSGEPVHIQCHCCCCHKQAAPSTPAKAPIEKSNQRSGVLHATCHCSNENSYFYPDDESLRTALDQHKGNLIDLVDERIPLLGWIYQILGRDPSEFEDTEYRLSLAEMHRMYMRALQIELANMGVAMEFDVHENATEKLKKELGEKRERAKRNFVPALRQYTQAIRDYEYMTTGLTEYDYFIVSSERYHDRDVLQNAMSKYYDAKKRLYKRKKNSALHTGPWEYPDNDCAEPIGGTRHEGIKKISRKAFWWKSSAALVGAGFLVGPMWLLALEQRLYLQLEATTGFVLGFGLTLAYFMDKVDQVFAGTLAYAAVLMVFVGLSVQGVGGA